MKKSVVIFLATLLGPALPAVNAWEMNQRALERFAQEPGRPPGGGRRQPSRETSAASISKLIKDINTAIETDKQRTLSIITINTDIAGTTLEKQKAQTGFSFGELYVAHSMALATRKKFNAIVALKKSGKSWIQIAREHKVALIGSDDLIREMQRKQ